jgi:hypothetical protein
MSGQPLIEKLQLNSSIINVTLPPVNGIATVTITTQPTGTLTDGTYPNVELITVTGTGTGAIATVVVSGGVVTTVTITAPGSGYSIGDTLGIPSADITGATANGVVTVATLTGIPGQSLFVGGTTNAPTVFWQLPTLSTLSNTSISGTTAGQVLSWNGTTSLWTNTSLGSLLSVVSNTSGITSSSASTGGVLTVTLGLNSYLQTLSSPSTTGFVQNGSTGYFIANLTSSQITTALGYTPSQAAGTVTSVAITGSTGLAVSGSPITSSGTITLTLSSELQGLSGLATTGLVTRTGTGTYTTTAITGNSDISVVNGNGVSGSPTLSLTNTGVAATTYGSSTSVGTFTVSSTGRITAASNAAISFPVTSVASGGNGIAVSPTTGATVVSLQTGTSVQLGSLGVGTTADGTVGDIRATGNITAAYSSDARLKENIVVISNALEKVNQLRGVTFDWTDEYIEQHGGEDNYFLRKHDIGVIAQEVEQVLPEVVATRDDGIKAVKYERIVALLIEAVKELNHEIKLLRNK